MSRHFVSSVREFCRKWVGRLACLLGAVFHLVIELIRFVARLLKPLSTTALFHLRHPTRRGVLLTLATPPALVLLYVIVLIPFTPSISDIRKARVDQPAQILSADGKLLAEFKPSNREWVALSRTSRRTWSTR